ncbi:alpha/beta hydrolase fold domain-containing protein [Hyphomonas oceanitis]|nr:alpha/beta hydrolase fold domain-containing protein [Hyphomonas oceanitis]
MSLETDTRLDHRLKKALDGLGLLGNAAPAEISRLDDHQAVVAAVKAQHEGFGALYEALPNDLVRDPVLGYTTHDVPTEDGHTVAVRVYRGAGAGQKVPCVIYYHGGGMVILDAFAKVHDRWCQDLAATGLVVVAVNYRNGYTEQGLHPFPTGLNDCFAALRWVNSRRESLGISKIMLQGESGGGNLALASALKAMKEGCIDAVDGVYANVPYISGGYSWDEGRKRAELPSLIASNGYFIECSQMDLLVAIYDPAGDNAENPLCWPYFAKERDLTGLPPHVIAVNELDPLRDEGIAFYRKLLAAGVLARARTNHGLVHAADLIFRQAIPDIYLASISDIASFARSL